MMKKRFLDAGRIVNTHGTRGEVKIVSWCDTPEFLCSFGTLYLDQAPIKVLEAKPHKTNALVLFDGVSGIDAAMRLKGKVVQIDRNDVTLPEGRHFLADLMGLEVRDADSGAALGTIVDILTPPSHEVYVVKGAHEYMIPAVDEFLIETNVEQGFIRVRLIEGMATDVSN